MTVPYYEDDDDVLPRPPDPPTERDGIKVGDLVTLVTHHGPQYPVRVLAFSAALDCDMVVDWLGVRPDLRTGPSTVCRRHLAAVVSEATL